MTTTNIEVAPFIVPHGTNLMVGADGLDEGPFVILSNLDPDALDALAATWLYNLYASVKRPSPFKFVPESK